MLCGEQSWTPHCMGGQMCRAPPSVNSFAPRCMGGQMCRAPPSVDSGAPRCMGGQMCRAPPSVDSGAPFLNKIMTPHVLPDTVHINKTTTTSNVHSQTMHIHCNQNPHNTPRPPTKVHMLTYTQLRALQAI